MIDLESIFLSRKWHEEHSLIDAVSMFVGEGFDRGSALVCPMLGIFGGELGRLLSDTQRQQLKRFIPRLPGTDDGMDDARAFLALDWLTRVYAVAWLRLVPELESDASLLAHLSPITDIDSMIAARDAVRTAAANARRVPKSAGGSDENDDRLVAVQFAASIPAEVVRDILAARAAGSGGYVLAAWRAAQAAGRVFDENVPRHRSPTFNRP